VQAAATPGPYIPALHEQLAILVSTGKAKKAIGVQLTHEQVKHLDAKDTTKGTRHTYVPRPLKPRLKAFWRWPEKAVCRGAQPCVEMWAVTHGSQRGADHNKTFGF